MPHLPRYNLFEVFGIELEYMIASRSDLSLMPLSPDLLRNTQGKVLNEIVRGELAISNELVMHVIELKNNYPCASLTNLDVIFHAEVVRLNKLLEVKNACLLPTGAHPFMNPLTDSLLWPYDNSPIYNLYNQIFDCRGHGWSNLQSMHLNLPFNGDEQFGRLHAAIRLVLPLIPAIAASTPMLDGALTGFADSRMETYRLNQKAIPSITGLVIPEAVFTKKEYHATIFDPIVRDITPYDTHHVLDKHFLNSRGAIARFDRNAIEIRVIDTQEAPVADIAIAQFIVVLLQHLVNEEFCSYQLQQTASTQMLYTILLSAIRESENAILNNTDFLKLFGITQKQIIVSDLISILVDKVKADLNETTLKVMKVIENQGTLSTRITKALGNNFDHNRVVQVYTELAKCLKYNSMYCK